MASDTVWVCEQCDPALWFSAADVAERHYADEHGLVARAEEWGEVALVGRLVDGDPAAMLEEWLPVYKKQVEQEFARTIAGLADLVIGAREKDIAELPSGEAVLDAAAAVRALKDFRQSVLVMADLPLDI